MSRSRFKPKENLFEPIKLAILNEHKVNSINCNKYFYQKNKVIVSIFLLSCFEPPPLH